ncbi:MAG TPA: hypothetical protein VK721_13240 [Solirubrobacteraceae bacterium]|nr:hypothetical protein [Solirubrobacteraceae bacterium]
MPGLFLNAYDVAFEGDIAMWRLPRTDGDDRRELERALSTALWAERDAFWSARELDRKDARRVVVPTGRGRLILFAAREALVDHAHQSGREAWFGRAGDMHFVGLLAAQESDGFVVEPELVVRLAEEAYVTSDAIAIVRTRSRWRTAATLADPQVAEWSVGESAIRLRGDGPRRGRVEISDGNTLRLRIGPDTHSVNPADYALVVRSRLVVAWRGTQALRDLNVASGMLTVSNKRNRYAVKDRFEMAGKMLRALEWPVPVSSEGKLVLGKPIGIRLEEPE